MQDVADEDGSRGHRREIGAASYAERLPDAHLLKNLAQRNEVLALEGRNLDINVGAVQPPAAPGFRIQVLDKVGQRFPFQRQQ